MTSSDTAARHVIAAQSGRAFRVGKGSLIKVINPEGAQVADVFAISADDPSEWMSTGHTRASCRNLFPDVGQRFVTNRYRPILSFVEDSSPGQHDMLYPACEPAMYERLGVVGHHPSCRNNFGIALQSAGLGPFTMPDPVNIFQSSPVTSAGDLSSELSGAQAGDSVTLRADMDLILVVTSCSQDIVKINGERCTPIHVEISGPSG